MIVSLDGIPGAGKSRLLEELKEKTNIVCLQEPVEEWSKLKDSKDNTLFSLYYNDQKRYALGFQLQVLHTRFEQLEKALREHPNSLIVTERDLMTDYKIFTQMLYDKNMFEEIEFGLYKELYLSYQRRLEEQNGGTMKRIYLTTSADVSHRRMMSRGRKEEKNVPLEYLVEVEKYHKSQFTGMENVLLVDGNEDWERLPKETLDRIVSFLS